MKHVSGQAWGGRNGTLGTPQSPQRGTGGNFVRQTLAGLFYDPDSQTVLSTGATRNNGRTVLVLVGKSDFICAATKTPSCFAREMGQSREIPTRN